MLSAEEFERWRQQLALSEQAKYSLLLSDHLPHHVSSKVQRVT
jgi:hypothetical protein